MEKIIFEEGTPIWIERINGVLYFRGKKSGKEYHILPRENDLIIMEGDVDHAPNFTPQSVDDRIVLAGNIGFHR